MRINNQIAVLVLACSLGGIVFSGKLFSTFTELEVQLVEVEKNKLEKLDFSHFTTMYRNWLLTIDLYAAQRQSYLLQALHEESQQLRDSLADNTDTHSTELVALIIKITRLLKNETRVPRPSEEDWNRSLAAIDLDSSRGITLCEKRYLLLERQGGDTFSRVESLRKKLQFTALVGVSLYIFLILAAWRWTTHSLVTPVESLSKAAEHIDSAGEEFRFNSRHGPKEIIAMGKSIETLVNQLMSTSRELQDQIHLASDRTIQLDSIMNTALEAILTVDAAGQIIHLNRAAREVLGTPMHTPEAITRFLPELVLSDILNACVINRQVRGLRHDRSEFPAEYSAASFTCDHNHMITIVLRDITSRVELQDQLVQARKMESLGVLSSGLAHEINTPLLCVSENIRFCSDHFEQLFEEKTDAETTEFVKEEIPLALKEALEASARVSQIIKAMNNFAHPPTQKVCVNINELIRNASLISACRWKEQARMLFELDGDNPTAAVFPGELSQVLINLMVNAAHAISQTDRDGVITISSRIGNTLIIKIEDNGCGIDSKVIGKIFDPFYTSKEIGEGTGQGLTIAHSIITGLHSGKLTCTSTPGEGSCFTIQLPLTESCDISGS